MFVDKLISPRLWFA